MAVTEKGMWVEGCSSSSLSLLPSDLHDDQDKNWHSSWNSYPFTSLATEELIPAVLHQLQDPLMLSINALPGWVTRGVQVWQVPGQVAQKKKQIEKSPKIQFWESIFKIRNLQDKKGENEILEKHYNKQLEMNLIPNIIN